MSGFDIAIVGCAGRFPGARSVEEYWSNLRAGVDSITRWKDASRGPAFVGAGGLLDDIENFDSIFFRYSPREARLMDPQHRIFLECAWQALENAAIVPEFYAGRIGAYASSALGGYLLNNVHPFAADATPLDLLVSNDKDFLATRLAYKFDLRGPCVVIQSACSSSLVAVHLACQGLLSGDCDVALAGGVTVRVPHRAGYLFENGMIFSPDGVCRAFDRHAQGGVPGNGAGVVVLTRLEDAILQRHSILAVIRGSAINNDGSQKAGYTAPNARGQSEVIAVAQAMAGVTPGQVGYIEAHGSGTPLGDAIEVQGLREVFGAAAATPWCALASVKTNIGHLDVAAGITGLIKAALAIKHGEIPASLYFQQANPDLNLDDSPFFVNTSLRHWPRNGSPRIAGVSSFGIGGTNAHVVLAEAPENIRDKERRRSHFFPVSALTREQVDASSLALAEALSQQSGVRADDVAFTLQAGRTAFPCRRFAIADSVTGIATSFAKPDTESAVFERSETLSPLVVFLFPGLGEQAPGMARSLYSAQSLFRESLDTCLQEVERMTGDSVLRDYLLGPVPEANPDSHLFWRGIVRAAEDVTLAHLALFSIEFSLARLWIGLGVQPAALLGFSLGEYVAACIAEVFSLSDAVRLVFARSKHTRLCPPGEMLAVGLGEDELRPWLDPAVEVAASCGRFQTVVSGSYEAIMALRAKLAEESIAFRPVHSGHAFHSNRVAAAAEPLRREFDGVSLHSPTIPLLSTVRGDWAQSGDFESPGYWCDQLVSPIRFSDALSRAWALDEPILLEIGPGSSLSALALQHPSSPGARALPCLPDPSYCFEDFLRATGRLWAMGCPLRWEALDPHGDSRRISLPGYTFARQSFWIDRHSAVGSPPKAPVDDWFLVRDWHRTLHPDSSSIKTATWLVFAQQDKLSRAIADALRQRGNTVWIVTKGDAFENLGPNHVQIQAGCEEHYHRLLLLSEATEAVHLWLYGEVRPSFETSEQLGFLSGLFLAKACPQDQPFRLTLIANGLHDIEETDRLHPEKSLLLGLARNIRQEFPSLRCQCLDPGFPADSEDVVRELISQAPQTVVAYRGRGRRFAESFSAFPIPMPSTSAIRDGGVYLITGGLGSIGQYLANYLAGTYGARLVLLSRSPKHQAAGVVEDIQRLGGDAAVLQGDISRYSTAHAAVREAKERFGGLDGVFHCAGLVWDLKSGTELTLQDAKRHFKPKCEALYALASALADERQAFCLLFSSTASVLPGPGLMGYASANAFMDQFALERASQPFPRWISVSWDGWGIGENAKMPTRTAIQDYFMVGEQALDAMERILASRGLSHVVVTVGPLEARTRIHEERNATPPETKPLGQPLEGVGEVEQVVIAVWMKVLGCSNVDPANSFFELGGDSLLGNKVVTVLREIFKIDLPLPVLWQHPTVREFAAWIESALEEEAGDPDYPQGAQEKPREPSATGTAVASDYPLHRLSPVLNQATLIYVARAFASLSILQAEGVRFTLEDSPVSPTFHKLIGRWLKEFERLGYVRRESQGYVAVKPIVPGPMPEIHADDSCYAVIIDLFHRAGENLHRLLSAQEDPLSLFFASGETQLISAYRDTHEAQFCLERAAEIAGQWTDTRMPRPCAALEVGGGLAITTKVMKKALPLNTHYTFTDLSPFFFRGALEAFPDASCQVFDFDREPSLAGFPPASFDFIIAANALHCAKDLPITLGHLRSLLRTEGRLLLIEATRNELWHTITMGLLKGFLHFEDFRLADGLTFLSRPQWENTLRQSGFHVHIVVPDEPQNGESLGQHVFLAGLQ